MTIEPEEYVTLNQPDNETPSTVSFVQDNYEHLKHKIKTVGFNIGAIILLSLHATQLCTGMLMLKNCAEDKYTPAYFIVAGLVGGTVIIAHFLLHRKKSRFPMLHQILYPFYIFEFCWLMVGTYYYIRAIREREGCSGNTYTMAYWIVVTNYICLTVFVMILCWALTMIFALVYFKNKIVQFLASSIRF